MWRITAVLCLLVAPAATGQQPEAGRIDRIAENVRPGKWQGVDSTSKVRLLRLPSPEWKGIGRKASVLLNDRMQVERLVDVQVGVESRAQQGKLIFLTELLDKDLRPVVKDPNGREITSASYQMLPSPDDPNLLAVNVEQGSLIIDWVHGRLQVITPITRFVIRGTKVALTVYPGGAAGFVLLQSGALTFLDTPGLEIKEERSRSSNRGMRLKCHGLEWTTGCAFTTRSSTTRRMFGPSPSGSRRPLVPAVAVAGAATAVVVSQSGDDDGPRGGSGSSAFHD